MKVVLVLVLLFAMVMVLMGISRLTHRDGLEEEREAEKLRQELRKSEKIISRHNLFSGFLARKK